MENNPEPDLADRIAHRILEMYEVGTSSALPDKSGYFDPVYDGDLAALIRQVINAG